LKNSAKRLSSSILCHWEAKTCMLSVSIGILTGR